MASLTKFLRMLPKLEIEAYYIKIIGVSLVMTASCVSEKVKKVESQVSDPHALEVSVDSLSNPQAVELGVKQGMVYFLGGKVNIGSQEGRVIEQPVFTAQVESFYLDKHPVTVAQFKAFVQATKYKTTAENFGNSLVYSFVNGKWEFIEGATWLYPFGQSKLAAPDNHPVTHVSYADASAYALWAKKRLPSEIEWEYAARYGKQASDNYACGTSLLKDKKYLANVWQGQLQASPQVDDGFLYTSPVGYYGADLNGLSDMTGNVWEWTTSLLESYSGSQHQTRAGPDTRVIRGGSFMFDPDGDVSNAVWFRSSTTTETALMNLGFRCAL